MERFAFEASPGRLDAVVARAVGAPRADVQRAIADGRVLVDGVRRPKSHRLQGGERVEGSFGIDAAPGPEPGGVAVRYEDDDLLVVSKPAGMVTHPTAGRRTGTLVNRLLGMGVALSTGAEADRPGIVHRLDAGTSGLLIVAKNDEAHERLSRMLAERRVERRYLALVRGVVADDELAIEAPIARRRGRMAVQRETGRPAETDVRVVERFEAATLLEVRPRTGRTHQIRVHLAAIGHPILGDARYGGGGDDAARTGLTRPFLHASRLRFPHPSSGSDVTVEEPLPRELRAALDVARMGTTRSPESPMK